MTSITDDDAKKQTAAVDDWETAAETILKPTTKKKWDDEDVEDEPKPEEKKVVAQSTEPKPKGISKKKAAKLQEEEEMKARREEKEHANDPSYKAKKKEEEEKLKIAEEGKVIMGLFGPEHTVQRSGQKEVTLDGNALSTAAEYDAFGKDAATKLCAKMEGKEASKNVMAAVKAFLTQVATRVKVEDVSEISKFATVTYNTKLRESKDKDKKKPAAKKTLNIKEKPVLEEYKVAQKESSDEYDFM